jgi:hypothetical protein
VNKAYGKHKVSLGTALFLARSRKEGLAPCYNEITWQCDFSAGGYPLPTEAE